MAERWKRTITTEGLNLLANVTDVRPIRIVRMACASGTCAEAELKAQTALTDEVTDIPIVSSEQVSGNVYRIEGQLDNAYIETGFYLKQIGIFAVLGSGTDEVLFEIVQVTDGGDRIPSAAESPGFLADYLLDLVFSSEINIEISVDSGSLAEAKAYCDRKVEPIAGAVAELTEESELIFGSTILKTLYATDWDDDDGVHYYTDVDAVPEGYDIADIRGTVGLADSATYEQYEAAANMRMFCVKNTDANKLRVYSVHPDGMTMRNIPIAINLEYAGGSGNAMISAFPNLSTQLEQKVGDLYDQTDLLRGDTIKVTLAAANWRTAQAGYAYQDIPPSVLGDSGALFDTCRGTVGIAEGRLTAADYAEIKAANLFARQGDSPDYLRIYCFGTVPTIDVVVAINLEHDNGYGTIISAFP